MSRRDLFGLTPLPGFTPGGGCAACARLRALPGMGGSVATCPSCDRIHSAPLDPEPLPGDAERSCAVCEDDIDPDTPGDLCASCFGDEADPGRCLRCGTSAYAAGSVPGFCSFCCGDIR